MGWSSANIASAGVSLRVNVSMAYTRQAVSKEEAMTEYDTETRKFS
jgi:hypothetical protein